MTNEELAEGIQQGHKEYIPILWEKVRKLIDLLVSKYYTQHTTLLKNAGYELADMKQESYFIFLKTVSAYNGKYLFNSYIELTLHNHFTRDIPRDKALCMSISMETPLANGEAEGNERTLGDMLSDENDYFEELIEADYNKQFIRDLISVANERLSKDEISTINGIFFLGRSFTQLSQETGRTQRQIRRDYQIALQKLRNSKIIRKYSLNDTIGSSAYSGSLMAWKNNDFTSSTERAANKLIEKGT